MKVIFCELVRPDHNLDFFAPDEGAVGCLRRHLRVRERALSACSPKAFQSVLWIHWKHSKPKPQSDLAVNSIFGLGPNSGPKTLPCATGLGGGGGARRSEISAQYYPRAPCPSDRPVGCVINIAMIRGCRVLPSCPPRTSFLPGDSTTPVRKQIWRNSLFLINNVHKTTTTT